MLRPFEIHEPANVAEASRLLAEYGGDAAIYAGGTELIPIMKDGLAHFGHLINIKMIPGLDVIAKTVPGTNAIERDGGMLRIGALATHQKIASAPLVAKHARSLAHAAATLANMRVRVVGTLGGNLCFAEPHSDPAAILLAGEAAVVLARNGRERRVPIESFFTGILQTAREADEVLVAVEVPVPTGRVGSAYARFATHERPTAGVAATVTIEGTTITLARLAVGSVGPVPARARAAEDALIGREAVSTVFDEAAVHGGREVEVLDDLYGSVEYKRHIVGVLMRQALRDAAAATGAGKE